MPLTEQQAKIQARQAYVDAGGAEKYFELDWPDIYRQAQRTAAAQAAMQPMNANQALGRAMKSFAHRNDITPGGDVDDQMRAVAGIAPRKRK